MQRIKAQLDQASYEGKLVEKKQTYEGAEVPSAVPVEPPIGYHRHPTMVETIRNMIRSEKLREEAESSGYESFEDADDFDVEDEVDPSSTYEFEDIFEPNVHDRPSPLPQKPAEGGGVERGDGAPPDSKAAPSTEETLPPT